MKATRTRALGSVTFAAAVVAVALGSSDKCPPTSSPLPPEGPDIVIDPTSSGNAWKIDGKTPNAVAPTGNELNAVAFGTKVAFEAEVEITTSTGTTVVSTTRVNRITAKFGGKSLEINASSGSFEWKLDGTTLTSHDFGTETTPSWRSDLCVPLDERPTVNFKLLQDGSWIDTDGAANHIKLKAKP
ncbi:MAG TPA: hypothetical protein VF139_05345 [Candidatus Polarisedimenticolaceae bacterium]